MNTFGAKTTYGYLNLYVTSQGLTALLFVVSRLRVKTATGFFKWILVETI